MFINNRNNNKTMAQDQMQVDFTQVINELGNRLRILESKQSLISEKTLIMNQNMIEEYKRIMKEMKIIDMETKEIKKDLANVKNIVKHLTEEASKFAKQSDVKVLEKYIKLWSPMNFVTEKQVEDMIHVALKVQMSHHKIVKKEDHGNHRHTSE